jgi:membrane-associated protease RseP (regulator of RpoE activity)
MFRRSFAFILVAAAAAAVSYGQTPDAKREKERAAQAFTFTLEDGGGYLGVQTTDVSKDNFAKYGLSSVRGVAVEKVLENSPAQTADLRSGDVIVRFDGEEVTSARKLTRLVGEVAPDHQVKVTVLRNGAEQDINVTVGKRPGPAFSNGNFEFRTPMPMGKIEMPDLKDLPKLMDIPELKDLPSDGTPRVFSFPGGEGKAFTFRSGSSRQIGVGITPLTKQLADHFGVEGGVMISEVRDGSPAFKAGLKAGDIIVEADGKAVKSEFDVIRTINEKKDGDVQLTFIRDRNRQTVSVTPEASKNSGFVFDTMDGFDLPSPPRQPGAVTPAKPAAPAPLLRPGRVL